MSSAGLHYGDTFVPHAQVMMRCARAASGLESLGVKRDDTVALMLRNDIAFLEATAGIRLLGALPVPINWHLSGEEMRYILEDSGARTLIVHSDLYHHLKDDVPEGVTVLEVATPDVIISAYGISDDEAAMHEGTRSWHEWVDAQEPYGKEPETQSSSMIYTSGTTGRPKGVRREAATPEQYAAQVQAVAGVLGVLPGVRTVIPAPMYHSAPNAYSFFALQLQTYCVIMPRFDGEDLLRVIDEHKITHLQMVPTMFVRLLKLPEEVRNKYDVSSLEYVIHAAAPCPAEVKKAMIEWWGPVIHEYYGSTEMSAVTLCTSEDALKYPGTVGRPVEGAEVRVWDEDGNDVPAGTAGTVYGILSCNSEFTYQNDDEKRASIGKGHLITSGDIGYFNKEGYLFLCDRANDMIISGGANIYPAEIESVLINCPGVQDCAVFGIPDPDFGESIAAFVEPDPGVAVTEDEVRAYLQEHLAKFKIPKLIEFRGSLPREDSGKLFKRKLRDPFWADTGRSI
jgi:long-chain acyl-CoA synthetase